MVDISVIITSYNYSTYIEGCIRSLLTQDLARDKFQVIVVDDFSTDNTIEMLRPYKDDIVLLRNKTNMGLAYTANQGIKAAKGQYIVRVDADDFVHEQFLNFLYQTLEIESEFHAVACDYFKTDRFGKKLARYSQKKHPIACGIMFHKDSLFDIGLYNDIMLAREEEELLIRYLEKYSLLYLPVALYRYRDHHQNLTKNQERMQKYADLLNKKKEIPPYGTLENT